jgi:hypothetical protein
MVKMSDNLQASKSERDVLPGDLFRGADAALKRFRGLRVYRIGTKGAALAALTSDQRH